jgi:hypothetical protein
LISNRTAITLVLAAIGIVVLYIVLRNPNFKSWLNALALPAATPPATAPPAAEGAGEFPYAPTSEANELEDQGQGTRHYASGKPDDVTHEWEGSTNAQSYMVVMDITLTETDHDDTVSVKYGGTHMGSGWYDNGYSFESGQACIGKEENHPSTDLCEVTGQEVGPLLNNRFMFAAVNINKGEKLEMWSKAGGAEGTGQWQKDVETGPGVTGFHPSEETDEIQIRIDAAPGIDMHSAVFYEIQGTGTSTSGGEITNEDPDATGEEGGDPDTGGEEESEDNEESADLARVLTAKKARKKMRRNLYNKTYRGYQKEDGDFIPYNYKIQDLHYQKIGGY